MFHVIHIFAVLCFWYLAPAHAADSIRYDNVVIVAIGISDYPDEPLPNAARDAQQFADLFRAEHTGLIELYDRQATRKEIIRAIRKRAPAMLRAPGDRNLLIVYFVGHGQTAGGVGFLAPYGAEGEDGWLAMSRLRDIAKQSKTFRHQLYILGSCFGGDVLRSVSSAKPEKRQEELVHNAPVARWVAKALDRRARVALTAGSARQKVPDGEVGHGSPFGRALVNALRTGGGSRFMAADFNRDGCVSHAELTAYVEGFGRTAHNTPRSGTLEGDDAGTVVLCQGAFAPPPAEARSERGRLRATGTRPGLPEGFVEVPAGSFVMGSPDGEEGRRSDEGPQHRVTFTRPLWVQTHEVTQAEWKRLMGSTPSFFGGCDDCPVERVNWYEALAYANARSRAERLTECYTLKNCGEGQKGAGCAEGKDWCSEKAWRCESVEFAGLTCSGYRLPTEAEWEYVARAGTTTRFSGGDAEAALARAGWYTDNSEGKTHPVGGKAANPWGLYDVHGNVSEWCHDWMDGYSTEAVTDPLGPSSGENRVIRGGSFTFSAPWVRSAARVGWGWPHFRVRVVGFRLVRAPRGP